MTVFSTEHSDMPSPAAGVSRAAEQELHELCDPASLTARLQQLDAKVDQLLEGVAILEARVCARPELGQAGELPDNSPHHVEQVDSSAASLADRLPPLQEKLRQLMDPDRSAGR